MSFRKIRPSSSTAESSASTSNPSNSTSESTGSDPTRQILTGEKQDSGNVASTSKRRRVPESVTRNACLNCKKARAKCDGKKPCTRCATRVENSQCVYEIHIKHAKEELIKQIKDLRTKDHLAEQIFQALSTNEQVPEILSRLQRGNSYSSIVEWLGRATLDEEGTVSPRESHQSAYEPSDQEMGGVNIHHRNRWTTVTNDSAIFDHLFQLYFAWVHPVHTLFSEGHFVEGYKRPSKQYCSVALVNAICAMGCHLHSNSDSDEVDFEQLGIRFSDAVRSHLDPAERNITTVQAFGVLFLVDCGRGRGLRASSYLKIASQMLMDLARSEEGRPNEVLRHTLRGFRGLNVEWAMMTFQLPNLAYNISTEPIDEAEQHLDEAQWYYYRDPSDQCPAWPGLLATTNREKAKLIEIINESVLLHYSPAVQHIQARNVLSIYKQLVKWRANLPKVIGNIEDNNSQALPHVLSLLILQSTTVVHLLRPLLDFPQFRADHVEQVIYNHAQQGLFLLNEHYRTQYTTRYQPVLQMFTALHLCDVIARFFPIATSVGGETPRKDGAQALQIGFDVLMESGKGFPIAGPFQELLKRTAVECGVRQPRDVDVLMAPPKPPSSEYRMDDIIDACTRPTYTQPVADIQMKYSSTFAADWTFEAPMHSFQDYEGGSGQERSEEERGAQNLMQIRNLLNIN